MKENFGPSLGRTLVSEGGLVDDPKDPGGRTFQGVTQRVYSAYRSRRGLPFQDVALMKFDERDDIYRAQYWGPIRGDALPAGLDYVVFDGAVNSGVAQSVKWLQRALGVSADGQIGQVTLDAIGTHPDIDRLIADVCARRLLFCRSLSTWRHFGKGWAARIAAVQSAGQSQAIGSVGPSPTYVSYGERKASISDAKKAPQTIAADASAGGGVSVAGLVAWIQDNTAFLVGKSDFVDRWLGYVMAIAALVALFSGAYAYWARKEAAKLADRLDTRPMQLAASPAVTDSTDVAGA